MNGTYLKFQKLNSQRMSRMGKVACHFIAAKLWLRERGKKKEGEEFHIRWKKREKMISLSVRSRNSVSREKGGQVLNKSVPSSCKLVLPCTANTRPPLFPPIAKQKLWFTLWYKDLTSTNYATTRYLWMEGLSTDIACTEFRETEERRIGYIENYI